MLKQTYQNGAWVGSNLEADRKWEFDLEDAHKAELMSALRDSEGVSLIDVDLQVFRQPHLTHLIERVRDELQHGCGFALLHNFPIEHSLEDIERLYWGMAGLMGVGVTQNSEAGLIHYVTDSEKRPNQGNRKTGRPGPIRMHVDSSDCVGLLCVRQASDNPLSRVASALHIYNQIVRYSPESLSLLERGFEWDRHGEHAAHESPTTGYRIPVFSECDGVVSCRYNRGWIRSAMYRLGRDIKPGEETIFNFIDDVGNESCLEFAFLPGDIQFVNNYTVLHGRAGHEEVERDEEKRLLLRVWIDFPEPRSLVDEGLIRYGLIRHGALGWTASDLREKRHLVPRRRRPNGLPVV